MLKRLNALLDAASEFFAHRKGLLPLIGIGCVFLDFIIQFLPFGWLSSSNLLEHIGIIMIGIGFMLAWAL